MQAHRILARWSAGTGVGDTVRGAEGEDRGKLPEAETVWDASRNSYEKSPEFRSGRTSLEGPTRRRQKTVPGGGFKNP